MKTAIALFLCTAAATAAADPALPDALAVAASPTTDAGAGCAWVRATVQPIGVVHLHDAKLQQSAGLLAMRRGRDAVRLGTVLATIVGQDPDGSLRGNHHLLFADGGLRTQNDRIAAKPGADKCALAVDATLYVVDGSGAFAGVTGTLTAHGTLNVCGGAGRVAVEGKVCTKR